MQGEPLGKSLGVLVAGVVLVAIGCAYWRAKRAAAAAAGAGGGAVGASWLNSSGTPDAVKDNRAQITQTNAAQFDQAHQALQVDNPTAYEVSNAIGSTSSPEGWALK